MQTNVIELRSCDGLARNILGVGWIRNDLTAVSLHSNDLIFMYRNLLMLTSHAFLYMFYSTVSLCS
jgi:hypothetical protein